MARVGIRHHDYEYWHWLVELQKVVPDVEELAVEVDFKTFDKQVVALFRNGSFCRVTIPKELQEEDAFKFLASVLRISDRGHDTQRQKSGCLKA